VHQKPAILKEFLDSLARLERSEIEIDYFFVDDNEIAESTNLLIDFAKQQTISSCVIFKNPRKQETYHCNETTHYWSTDLIWKVASFKDRMIERARYDGYDYLFLIDSDIVMNPRTIEHLVRTQKDVISEIFWTQWLPEQPELPQVWVSDIYNLYEKGEREQLSQEQIYQRQNEFLTKLRIRGVYEIGGLGACTLISKQALQAGVNFKKIKNITFWGEDRHFCIRASALGLPLFVDTHYPAYHIYRESALEGVNNFIIANN
jgi:GT2 family glycosyltransferase